MEGICVMETREGGMDMIKTHCINVENFQNKNPSTQETEKGGSQAQEQPGHTVRTNLNTHYTHSHPYPHTDTHAHTCVHTHTHTHTHIIFVK